MAASTTLLSGASILSEKGVLQAGCLRLRKGKIEAIEASTPASQLLQESAVDLIELGLTIF